MKTNRFFTAILSVALCMNFVSCDDDEENKGGIDGNTKKVFITSYCSIICK